MVRRILSAVFLILLAAPSPGYAQERRTPFTDLIEGSEIAAAVQSLQVRGIVQGRPDGTFGPDDQVNRAEAVTIVVRAVANVSNLPSLDRCFPDVAGDVWFVKPVCYARDLAWVSGYPDGTFQPIRTVSKAEYIKILLSAYGVDTEEIAAFGEPLSSDVRTTDQWHYPYFAYAVGAGMTTADDQGQLNPGIALTRGQVALLTDRFLGFRDGVRLQDILFTMESDLRRIFSLLDALETNSAREAAGRVRVMTWSVLQKLPENTLVQAGAKIAEGVADLTRAYALVRELRLDEALALTRSAYGKADAAGSTDAKVELYAQKTKDFAHSLAESIRSYQVKGGGQ